MLGIHPPHNLNLPPPSTPASPCMLSPRAAHWYTVNYREAYGIFACNGILFNHESPGGARTVTRKITRAVGRIKIGLKQIVILGESAGILRTGVCWGLRRSNVDDAAARQAGRLCGSNRGVPHGRGVLGSGIWLRRIELVGSCGDR
ncbi:hypothetical protein HAX54_036429 [Datura stramonium]|uniref:NAD(P)-binding domain-containing protein n=1 Tax=Datura stramonium TaxID=4076 RepID=A0ABS8SG81_DATST|nr:hypothetical protein [Datura stramonium]